MHTFDALTAAKELQAVGFERAQAEAVARTIQFGHGNLATRDDIGWIKWALSILVGINLAVLAITFSVLRLVMV